MEETKFYHALKIDNDRCVGCKVCTIACPFGTVNYNTATGKVIKCDLCGGDPKCAEACPTAGAIVWDMPYTVDFSSYYLSGHEKGEYKIREHKAKGLMLPEVKEQKFRADITMSAREAHANVSDF